MSSSFLNAHFTTRWGAVFGDPEENFRGDGTQYVALQHFSMND
jgi:hypothetical protein